jgi:hypothetical protein
MTEPLPLLTTYQAAAFLGTKRRTLEDWRVTGMSGLPFIKLVVDGWCATASLILCLRSCMS